MTMKVAVDAGHGGFGVTPGKRTPDGEYEWNFNNKVAIAVIERLHQYGIQTLRTDDATGRTDVALSTRAKRANNWGANVFVSCHHNANTSVWSNKWGGTETFSLSASATKATKLANIVHKRLVKATGLQNRGVKHANYQVLRDTSMPAILTEGGFMDSTIDIKYMRNSAWLASQGYAIADGIAEYLGLKVIGSTTVTPAGNSNTEKYYKSNAPKGLYRVIKECGEYDGVKFKESKRIQTLKVGTAFTVTEIIKVRNVYRLKTKSKTYVTAKKENVEKV